MKKNSVNYPLTHSMEKRKMMANVRNRAEKEFFRRDDNENISEKLSKLANNGIDEFLYKIR